MSQTRAQKIGKWGEAKAAEYLESHGYTILTRNARTPFGEIDLVVISPEGEMVFIEVKTRTGSGFGNPEEAVDARKLAHLVSSAQAYVLSLSDSANQHWRIDVISIQGQPEQEARNIHIEHFENIAT